MLLAQPVGEADQRHRVRYLWMAWPHREFEERFATTLVQIYALGEIGVVSYRRGGTEVGATGQVLPEMEVRIVDEVDRPVAHGDVGEITVRPRQPHRVMLGYLNNLPATMRAFRNLWFHTGDYGHVAEDGELYFQGRIGDTIRRRGVNISSEQIESEALRHPNVRECAVIGVPSVLGEEDIHACLVWRETPADIDAAVADLLRFLQERLPRSYVPRYIELAHELPKTNTGKVRKTELRDRPATGRCWDRETTRWLGEVG
jgi:crotonobetaine/carnitine-CoA ligase